MIRVHAKVPPKPDKVILKKARKSSACVGIGAAGKCGTAVSDMAEISSLWSPPRPIDLWRYGQINHHECGHNRNAEVRGVGLRGRCPVRTLTLGDLHRGFVLLARSPHGHPPVLL